MHPASCRVRYLTFCIQPASYNQKNYVIAAYRFSHATIRRLVPVSVVRNRLLGFQALCHADGALG